MDRLDLCGDDRSLHASLAALSAAATNEMPDPVALKSLRLVKFHLGSSVSALLIRTLKRHSNSVRSLAFEDCTGHVDIAMIVAMTMDSLEELSLATGKMSAYAFNSCARSLGTGLQLNLSLKKLTLSSGSKVFFSITDEASRMLSEGLHYNCGLETLALIGCRFLGDSVISNIAKGLEMHGLLKHVVLRSCFASNGTTLGDIDIAKLLQALSNHAKLETLDLTGNKCLDHGIGMLSNLLGCSCLSHVNLSCQHIESGRVDEAFDRVGSMNTSKLVSALARTKTLKRIELQSNQLIDEDMAYIVAALTQNSATVYVGLNNNHLGDTGLSILAAKVPKFLALRDLVLTNNDFTSHGLSELAIAMRKNLSLEKIDLDSNYMYTRVGRSIRYHADFNWAGRRLLVAQHCKSRIVSSLWPYVLERSNKIADNERRGSILYSFIRHGPILFPL